MSLLSRWGEGGKERSSRAVVPLPQIKELQAAKAKLPYKSVGEVDNAIK